MAFLLKEGYVVFKARRVVSFKGAYHISGYELRYLGREAAQNRAERILKLEKLPPALDDLISFTTEEDIDGGITVRLRLTGILPLDAGQNTA